MPKAETLSDRLLSSLSEFVAAQMGLYFPRERWRDLERGMVAATGEFGFKNAESCVHWLLASPLTKEQIEILAGYLTIGETYFFREKKDFDVLEQHILPELIHSRRDSERRLRIWSAGCATGEEAYSIAVILSQVIPDFEDWTVTILATDINPRSLRRASEGLYSEWSFRGTPPSFKERCFRNSKDGRLAILPAIRNMVTFRYLNLAEDVYPSLLNNTNAMDVIFCRNVLMYFALERAKKVISNLFRSLVEGGWLIVSPSEASHVLFSQFMTVHFPGAILYRKDSRSIAPLIPLRLPDRDELSLPAPPGVLFAAQSEPEASSPPEISAMPPPEVKAPKRALVELNPYWESLALYREGHYAEAERKILWLLSQHPNDARAMALLARVYANQGRLADARGWCEKAIAADKLNPATHYLFATILEEQGALEAARTALQRTLYLDHDFVLAHFALGNLARQQGELKESEKYFRNTLSLLGGYRQEEILPESEGMTAGRLREILGIQRERPAGAEGWPRKKKAPPQTPSPWLRKSF